MSYYGSYSIIIIPLYVKTVLITFVIPLFRKQPFLDETVVDKIGNSARSYLWGKSSREMLLQSHLPQKGQFRITLSLLLPHTLGKKREEIQFNFVALSLTQQGRNTVWQKLLSHSITHAYKP